MLRPAESSEAPKVKILRPQQFNVGLLTDAMKRAHEWMKENYRVDIGVKRYYYLYGPKR